MVKITVSEINIIEQIIAANKSISIQRISKIANIESSRCTKIIKQHPEIFNIEKLSCDNLVSMERPLLKLNKTSKLLTFIGNAPRNIMQTWDSIEHEINIDMSLQKNRSMLWGIMRKTGVEWNTTEYGITILPNPDKLTKAYTQNVSYKWAHSTCSTHKRNGYIIDITIPELLTLANVTKTCCYCGNELMWVWGESTRLQYPSLDRIDNSSNISASNVEIICRKCNVSKGARTKTEFLEYCKMIVDKFGD